MKQKDLNIKFSSISFSIWILLILTTVFMMVYIYVNEYEKHESLRLSEEESLLKSFQEKEILRLQDNGSKNITKKRSIYINK